ncbi:helix-turn-helix domain-containing protein [Flavobacterium alkalisoli]|uniref:Helix-turn-helix domain-containing protein n=1 Tax=Flavobacterium alkalisoli TaxID=2602769 RepID=A0A5B9FZ08_9FLAO|nr:helix-turn-helix domain-containing protein [Flavobacterium alkalisoli]QEE51018.1 helix-turn-helix domain-containing protein [Flavobacterium alkalisoli]
MKTTTSLAEFYAQIKTDNPHIATDQLGHFNVFEIEKVHRSMASSPVMPYDKRTYFKISLIKGANKVEYADKTLFIERYGLLFATPKIPYSFNPVSEEQSGFFCVFTYDFLASENISEKLDMLPVFRQGATPVFEITEQDYDVISLIYRKMQEELDSDYVYRYDLLRNYVLELVHKGQKLMPEQSKLGVLSAGKRIVSLFIELLERQFPIDSPKQRLQLRKAEDYAARLAIHVNHLNKTLKEETSFSTKQFINLRIAQEAKTLLRETDWPVAVIAECLAFEEISHFSNFFKKQTGESPVKFRAALII